MSASTGTAANTNPTTTGAGITGNPDSANPGMAAGTAGAAPGIGASGGTGVSGQGIGDKIKGGLGVIHGAGEALRGSFNHLADQAGEGIAGRKAGDPQPVERSDGGIRSAEVANNGVDEINRGMDAFKR